MYLTTTLVSIIDQPNSGTFRITVPRWKVGDHCRLKSPMAHVIGEPVVIVESIEGPYINSSVRGKRTLTRT